MSAPVAQRRSPGRNVIGTELVECALDVRGSGINAGLYRDGHCDSGPGDSGKHTVCVEATPSFLAFSAAVGNPLHMPAMRYHFPGLNAGDKWCLCAERWTQAHAAGVCARTAGRTAGFKAPRFGGWLIVDGQLLASGFPTHPLRPHTHTQTPTSQLSPNEMQSEMHS